MSGIWIRPGPPVPFPKEYKIRVFRQNKRWFLIMPRRDQAKGRHIIEWPNWASAHHAAFSLSEYRGTSQEWLVEHRGD